MFRNLRLVVLLLCVPLLAFQCWNINRIVVDMDTNGSTQSNKSIQVKHYKFDAVKTAFLKWASSADVKKLDEPACHSSSATSCESYRYNYTRQWLFQEHREGFLINLYVDSALAGTVIEILEGKMSQSDKAKKVQDEIYSTMTTHFGKASVHAVH
jgi:hypothetical protein